MNGENAARHEKLLLLVCHLAWQMASLLEMEAVITMDKFGRIVLPGPMRKALQLSRAAAFKAEVMGNKVELTLVGPERSAVLKRRRGLLVVSTGGPKFNAAEAVSAMRQDRF
jgi:bifunctional DNA-binding transcriptional regulator/antitoxin component of YhaV-PrlF toxin-antitoxin module